ncbi:hypothetical protein [Streptomyces sp. NPDC005732]|uniref:hypothetical protein n=1 Tax=Streptomyces sp. NPDC005732 TaxID=3157057 RepID=UPI0033FD5485
MICTLCTTTTLTYGTLCTACTLTTLQHLQRLPRIWASLEVWLTRGSTGPAQFGGRGRSVEAPLPLNGEALTLRAAGGIAGVLEDWNDAVRETRGRPGRPRTGALAHRVRIAAGDLVQQINFIALWDQGPQLGREIDDLVHRAQAVAQRPEPVTKGTYLGSCVAVDSSGVICGAELWAQPGQRIACTWCLCPYPPDQWLTLLHHQPRSSRRHDDDQEPALDRPAADLTWPSLAA